jgi:hypothetical protein
MSAPGLDPLPAFLNVPRELRLRDVADLQSRIATELAAGTSAIHVVGVESLSFGSRAALDSLAKRLAKRGVSLDLRRH